MALPPLTSGDELGRDRVQPSLYNENERSHASAVSWGAIFAGAAAAAALSLVLLMLGTGLGLSSVSAWAQAGVSATTFGVSTILWITLTQLLASGMGGYLAGRLRTKWVGVHTDEVYFRDTAHGFLAWAVASLATAALLTSVIGSMLGTDVQAGAAAAAGAATASGAVVAGSETLKSSATTDPTHYFIDSLFRKDPSAPANASSTAAGGPVAGPQERSGGESTAEVTRIFMNSLRTGPLPAEDARYAGQIVAQRTGLSQQDAQMRVNDTYARMQAKLRDAQASAKAAADKARKAAAYGTLWIFISLLIGAFVASLAATYGGRRRDL